MGELTPLVALMVTYVGLLLWGSTSPALGFGIYRHISWIGWLFQPLVNATYFRFSAVGPHDRYPASQRDGCPHQGRIRSIHRQSS